MHSPLCQAHHAPARPGYINHIQIVIFHNTIAMGIDKIQSGGCAPVPQQSRLYMFN
jgi:hypothetical protein